MPQKLGARLVALALLAMIGMGAIVAVIEIAALYHEERRRISASLSQLAAAVAPGARRAAFHVDEAQAAAIVTGLMRAETMRAARIATERGESLAARRAAPPISVWDPLSRALFEDLTRLERRLRVSAEDLVGAPRAEPPPGDGREVGVLELELSSEVLGARFLASAWIVIAALTLEVAVLGGVLLWVVHRLVVAPLARIGAAIGDITVTDARAPALAPTLYRRDDELGLIIERTNEMIARIKEQQQEVTHREKVAALGSLLAGVSHEINNPLAIAIAQAELLEETAPDEATRRRAAKILSPAKRCAQITHTFLSMMRHREMEMEEADIAEMIEEAVSILDFSLEGRGVAVEIVAEPGLAPLRVDRAQIGQVVLNLLLNAAQAMAERPEPRLARVSARAAEGGATVEIAVADTGPGVPLELRERVLEPFFTTKRHGEGTGLGLSYANGVVRAHGGEIRIGASALGGAEFTVRLPRRPAPPAAAPADAAQREAADV